MASGAPAKGKREVRDGREERKHGKKRGGTVPGVRERRQGLRESEEDLHSSGSKREEETLDRGSGVFCRLRTEELGLEQQLVGGGMGGSRCGFGGVAAAMGQTP